MYAVVEFLEEKSVEVALASWVEEVEGVSISSVIC